MQVTAAGEEARGNSRNQRTHKGQMEGLEKQKGPTRGVVEKKIGAQVGDKNLGRIGADF